MPTPSTSLASLRPDLAGALEEFDLAADRQGFIAHRMLPVFDVAIQSGTFGKIPLEQLLQNRETDRNDRGAYNRGDWTFTDVSYATTENGWEEKVDDREAKIYANYFDAEVVSTMRAVDFILRRGERRAADLLFNATTWTGAELTTAVTNEWDDPTDATPIVDVEAAVRKVWDQTGLWPNALTINRNVFRNLRNCDEIIERIASSGAGSPTKPTDITALMLAQCFDLDHILVAGSAQNTAGEGVTRDISSIWSDEFAMVSRICESNDIREPGLGRTMHWAGDGSEIDGRVETYRDEVVRADIVRVRNDTQELLLYIECAHLLSNVTTIA